MPPSLKLARQLLELDRDIKDTDKLITSRFRAHPAAEIIESLPGLGPILGAEFLVATGGTLAGFANAGKLAAYAGLVPVPTDSGRVSIRASGGPSRVFYDRKRGERMVHTQALLALACRLVDVLWALLRDSDDGSYEDRHRRGLLRRRRTGDAGSQSAACSGAFGRPVATTCART